MGLCSTPVSTTADGNYLPLFCAAGELNVVAWKGYAKITPHVLSAGPNPSLEQLRAAFNADFGLHATNVEALYGYQLAEAYYGWKFSPSPACEDIYGLATC